MIGLNPGAVGVQDAEPVGVTIGRQSDRRFFRKHRVAQRTQILFGNVGPGAIEENIPVRPHGLDRDTVGSERAVKVPRAATVQRICNDAQFRVA